MRALIDAWWPMVERGEVEAIVMTASGCGATVKDYGTCSPTTPRYRDKAERISALTRDLCARSFARGAAGERATAAGSPSIRPARCSTGSRSAARSRRCSTARGYELTPVRDAHLCCGSAGTYSLLQPAIAGELRARKLAALEEGAPAGDRHRQYRLPGAPAGRHRARRCGTGSSCVDEALA